MLVRLLKLLCVFSLLVHVSSTKTKSKKSHLLESMADVMEKNFQETISGGANGRSGKMNGMEISSSSSQKRSEKTNGDSLIGEPQHKKSKVIVTSPEESDADDRVNQFGDYDNGYMDGEYWRKRWQKGHTRFHKGDVHGILVKYYDRLTKGEKKQRIFLPLCGKSYDLKWLSDEDQIVVGLEYAVEGVLEFFEENQLEYTSEPIGGNTEGNVYRAKDRDITIYQCDFYKIDDTLLGKFDCIWDRGGLAAVNVDDRRKYFEIMSSLIKKDGNYLVDLFELDHKKYFGPPFNFDEEAFRKLFGERFNVEKIEERDAMNPWSRSWGVEYFIQKDYFLTLKD